MDLLAKQLFLANENSSRQITLNFKNEDKKVIVEVMVNETPTDITGIYLNTYLQVF